MELSCLNQDLLSTSPLSSSFLGPTYVFAMPYLAGIRRRLFPGLVLALSVFKKSFFFFPPLEIGLPSLAFFFFFELAGQMVVG